MFVLRLSLAAFVAIALSCGQAAQTPDAGSDSGAIGSDAMVPDDSGLGDAGIDGGADASTPPTGVTCIVDERSGCDLVTTTYTDVDFRFAGFAMDPTLEVTDPHEAITSSLAAFQTLYNTTTPPSILAIDAARHTYTLSGIGTPTLATRADQLLNVDFDVQRTGTTTCMPPVPRVRIRCTGSTTLEYMCPPVLLPGLDTAPMLTCTAERRNASCEPQAPTSATPRFWLTDGVHGSESELHTDWAPLVELTGDATFYGSVCRRYYHRPLANALGIGATRFSGSQIYFDAFSRGSPATCIDSLGNPQSLLIVRCSAGRATIGAPP
jgi:hypothetical protein